MVSSDWIGNRARPPRKRSELRSAWRRPVTDQRPGSDQTRDRFRPVTDQRPGSDQTSDPVQTRDRFRPDPVQTT